MRTEIHGIKRIGWNKPQYTGKETGVSLLTLLGSVRVGSTKETLYFLKGRQGFEVIRQVIRDPPLNKWKRKLLFGEKQPPAPEWHKSARANRWSPGINPSSQVSMTTSFKSLIHSGARRSQLPTCFPMITMYFFLSWSTGPHSSCLRWLELDRSQALHAGLPWWWQTPNWVMPGPGIEPRHSKVGGRHFTHYAKAHANKSDSLNHSGFCNFNSLLMKMSSKMDLNYHLYSKLDSNRITE